MILIFSNTDSPRLSYICRFIFREQLGIEYQITTDESSFLSAAGPKISYSDNHPSADGVFHISPHQLLFETNITQQKTDAGLLNGLPAVFPTPGRDLAFDIFATSFFLISRYEEYLPHEKDEYGRFGHRSAVAFQQGFLDKPLINIRIRELAEKLKTTFPGIRFKWPDFSFLPTYDIDIAYQFSHKGFARSVAGLLRQPSLKRLKAMSGLSRDPFDIYAELDSLHSEHALQPVYFFLAAKKRGRYDRNNPRNSKAMRRLIKSHGTRYQTGMHPSWHSHEHPESMQDEKKFIENILAKKVTDSRQHYIRFELPGTFRNLIRLGIRNEYSMGYGSINGFRASVCSSFYWYDLEKNEATGLRIHPFCYMDANCYFEEKMGPEAAFKELAYYHDACRNVNGTLVTIFHNMFMADNEIFSVWKENYFRFIDQL